MNMEEMLETVKALPKGDYAECGVWKGFSAARIADGMNLYPVSWLWLFDTFRGHDEPGEFDDPRAHPKGRYSDTSAQMVRSNLSPLHQHFFIVEGRVQDTLSQCGPSRFRFVHIDLDHYAPTKAACEFFKSRMVPGGIIRFDDYRFAECPGATKAVDEVFGRENILPEDYRWVAA